MSEIKRRDKQRNIAIIAHVDHGKTTLVDAILKQTGAYEFKEGEDTVMDSNDLERERGITIFSKIASCEYKDHQINIVDTPGHADFGSEVERILKMVDGVLLLVDAADGPMPQTKFVLQKSLELDLKPILVVNKIDKPSARPDEVINMAFDLFCELHANDEQLDFPVIYASAKEGYAVKELEDEKKDIYPLLDTVLENIQGPIADLDKPLQMLVTMLDYDTYLGQMGVGRVVNGKVKQGENVSVMKRDGSVQRAKITKVLTYRGMGRVASEKAEAGDLCTLAGLEGIKVGETVACAENPEALPVLKIDEPTISMNFSHNTSPLAGKDGGKFLTSRHIRERLAHEAMMNPGIRVEEVDGGERYKVSGRGELHLSILIETMRREGYELEVSRPEVIVKVIDGKKCEPIEKVYIDVETEYQGTIMQELGERKGEMLHMEHTAAGTVKMEYAIASRALIGFRNVFLTQTRGSGIMCQNFYEYQPYKGELSKRPSGVLISMGPGTAVSYALWGLQERGEIFLRPQDELYEGMVVGVNNKGHDLVVNAIREKKLTNMRSSGADESIQLIPPREITLEFALDFIADDELVEITPLNVRLRKRYLSENERKRHSRAAK